MFILCRRCLNWTKVGLKASANVRRCLTLPSLNWTKVGLKVQSSMSANVSEIEFELD